MQRVPELKTESTSFTDKCHLSKIVGNYGVTLQTSNAATAMTPHIE